MQPHEHVLIALVRSLEDWNIARNKNWFRIPVHNGPSEITAEWIAFYFSARFGDEKWGIHYYARIRNAYVVRRIDLFPDEPRHPRAQDPYHVISFDPPAQLARPLVSDRGRRLIWSRTTWWRFTTATTLDEVFSDDPLFPPKSDQVLVGVVPRISDFRIMRDEHWYRIPCAAMREWITPRYLAFYFGRAFGDDAGRIRYYADVTHADIVKRIDLFPNQRRHPRAHEDYYRIHVSDIHERARPINSYVHRKLVVMPTTWERFSSATSLNELVTGDKAEEVFYGRLREEGLPAERAYYVRGTNAYHLADMALFCKRRNVHIDIEASRTIPRKLLAGSQSDKQKDAAEGWEKLRLSRFDIAHRTGESIKSVQSLVDRSGGILTPP